MASRIGRPPGSLDTHRAWHDLDDAWQKKGHCHGAPPEVRRLFFSDTLSSRVAARLAEQEAKAICLGCPVQAECLEYALAGDMHGIWGGFSQSERNEMMKNRRRSRVRRTAASSNGTPQ